MTLVLLIDDEPSMEKLVSMCIADGRTRAHVVRAGGLDEALKVAQMERPSVVLLDLALGHEDGLSILPNLREDDALAGVPVVVFSVHDSRREEALSCGVDGFVAKPFKTKSLRDVLEPYLR